MSRICTGIVVALVLAITFGVFMIYVGWPAVITAALLESDARRNMAQVPCAKSLMLGISAADRSCLTWQQRGDLVWVCTKR